MSKFNNFLSVSSLPTDSLDGNGQTGSPVLRDYKHASRLYVDNYQDRAPKYGFLYYVDFVINDEAKISEIDGNVGMLVKKVDLPKFAIKTETLNQYNRKTQVHTGLTYNPITIDFHDDTIGITNNLWVNYYKNLVADSNYDVEKTLIPRQFTDTKYGAEDYEYGIYNRGVFKNFFSNIDIYILNHTQQNHTLISLINPKITEWRHDTLNQSEGGKVLQNSMTLVYENVLYYTGTKNSKIPGFVNEFYDSVPSPLTLGGIPGTTEVPLSYSEGRPSNAAIYDSSKASQSRSYSIPGKQVQSSFDQPGKPRQYGVINPPNTVNNPLVDFAAILAKNYVNQKGFGRVGPVGYNIASSALNSTIRSPAGKYYEPPTQKTVAGLFNLPGGVGINVFKSYNTSVDGKIRLNPAAIVLPPKR